MPHKVSVDPKPLSLPIFLRIILLRDQLKNASPFRQCADARVCRRTKEVTEGPTSRYTAQGTTDQFEAHNLIDGT